MIGNPVFKSVKDNLDEDQLTMCALKQRYVLNQVIVVCVGDEAMEYLFSTGMRADRDIFTLSQIMMLDLKLPELRGLDVLKRVCGNLRFKSLFAVILSGYRIKADSYAHKMVKIQYFAEAMLHFGCDWLLINTSHPIPLNRA
jgi:CheY-like chemotaxis protein